MIDLEACALAAEMIRVAGFEHRYTSLKSESVYYGLPGRHQVIRVACHRARRNELNGVPIVATVTFNERNFREDAAGVAQIGREFLVRTVSAAIGRYMLVSSGALHARAKYRDHWPDGRTEIDGVAALTAD